METAVISVGDISIGSVNIAVPCFLHLQWKKMWNVPSTLTKTKWHCFAIHVHRFAKLSSVLGDEWVPVKNPSSWTVSTHAAKLSGSTIHQNLTNPPQLVSAATLPCPGVLRNLSSLARSTPRALHQFASPSYKKDTPENIDRASCCKLPSASTGSSLP